MEMPVYRTMHYSELDPPPPGILLTPEWETFRREVPRLLAEGREGAHILIQGTAILGIWESIEQARAEAQARNLQGPYFVYCISPAVPCVLITRLALPCRTIPIRLTRTA